MLNGYLYYNKQCEPIDWQEYARLCEEKYGPDPKEDGYHRVGSTHVGEYWISTVWIGIDMGYDPDGPPIIFETMVFAGEGVRHDLDCRRYATEEEAKQGHEEFVTLIKACVQTLEEAGVTTTEEKKEEN